MKIAIFSDTFFPDQINGAAHAAFQTATMMESLGHEVAVFTVSADKHKPSHLQGKHKFQIVRVPSMPLPGYQAERFTLPPFSSVLRKVSRFNPDIIHTHTPFALGWEAVRAAKNLSKPLVGTHHTFYDHYLKHIKLDYTWFKSPSWKVVVKYYNQCDLVLCPSSALASQLKHSGLTKPIQVFSNAVNTEFFHPASTLHPPPSTLIYMGRVSYEKSIDQVLYAFAEVLKNRSGLKLTIVGDGPERVKLERLSESLGITNKVEFTGMILGPELVRRLQSADIFVTASKSENQPLSILEAMACGLPILGVDALGVPEVVKNGVNGLIITPDNPVLLAAKIFELLQDEQLLLRFAASSRNIALNFSETTVAKKLETIYQNFI